jgi:hypothetical protein
MIAVLVHPHQDRQGKIGREMSLFDTVTTCALMQVDSNGTHTLAQNAVADATIKPDGSKFIIDICTTSNPWTEITKSGSHVLGNTFPIRGGISHRTNRAVASKSRPRPPVNASNLINQRTADIVMNMSATVVLTPPHL